MRKKDVTAKAERTFRKLGHSLPLPNSSTFSPSCWHRQDGGSRGRTHILKPRLHPTKNRGAIPMSATVTRLRTLNTGLINSSSNPPTQVFIPTAYRPWEVRTPEKTGSTCSYVEPFSPVYSSELHSNSGWHFTGKETEARWIRWLPRVLQLLSKQTVVGAKRLQKPSSWKTQKPSTFSQ